MTDTKALSPRNAEHTADDFRFGFGKNWASFLAWLNQDRIEVATRAIASMLETDTLAGKTFLDIGSGSGLSSLSARRLGARVVSFDYDRGSVACTASLRDRFYPGDPDWQVGEGSALDADYMSGLGTFDVVYSWGVLHHTGSMWEGLELAGKAVKPNGLLFISIYNDQGRWSRLWRLIKKTYNQLPTPLRVPFVIAVMTPRELLSIGMNLIELTPMRYVRYWTRYSENRGMSRWHDLVDWVGGFPFEVARPEEVFSFFRTKGFTLERLKTCAGGQGCNEYVFRKSES
jgi:2-polyprenyl-6-hydroxyphenyl methylase/3-demethylubiquinone-9 3-methyltransferase